MRRNWVPALKEALVRAMTVEPATPATGEYSHRSMLLPPPVMLNIGIV